MTKKKVSKKSIENLKSQDLKKIIYEFCDNWIASKKTISKKDINAFVVGLANEIDISGLCIFDKQKLIENIKVKTNPDDPHIIDVSICCEDPLDKYRNKKSKT